MLKKLDVFLLKSFIGPFLATFFVSTLVLLMQFLWKYIDDLVGKGLEGSIIAELLFYSTANLIPSALPLAVLLASIMTYGNLGEKYELVAIKASGIPLRRSLYPIWGVIFMLAIGSFFFANNVIPVANLKAAALYWDVKNKKPAFDIKEGVFYNDIKGYNIKIGKKDKDGKVIHDVIIYDQTAVRGNAVVVVAEKGEMTRSDDKRFLYFTLYNGRRYEEMKNNPDYRKTYVHNTMKFESQQIIFDLSQLDLNYTPLELFKGNHTLKRIDELEFAIDSLKQSVGEKVVESTFNINTNFHFYDTLNQASADSVRAHRKAFDSAISLNKALAVSQALNNMRTVKGIADEEMKSVTSITEIRAKHEVEWHKKLTLPAACLVLFLIGAPLGAIVRKGGFGLPVVIAILLFIVFYILTITGEKMARELVVPARYSMWLAVGVLTPFGAWLITKASRDSSLFDPDAYKRLFRKLTFRKTEKDVLKK